MIELPKRSVTRFFIPLIDVLILLFCMFLLLPFVSKPESSVDGSDATGAVSAAQLKQLEDQLKLRDEEVRRLQEERAKIAELTHIRVLEIDGDTGELSYTTQDGAKPQRIRITGAAQALELIQLNKQRADGQQVYFLVLYPRVRSRYPTESQVRSYEAWLRTVPHQFDNPFATK